MLLTDLNSIGKLHRIFLVVLFCHITVNTTIIFAVLCSEFSELKKGQSRENTVMGQ